jgi:glycine cleavage system protein P-like pyridoxal-binding family
MEEAAGGWAVGVKAFLADYLPMPLIKKEGKEYSLIMTARFPLAGKIFLRQFWRDCHSYAYILALGKEGIRMPVNSGA